MKVRFNRCLLFVCLWGHALFAQDLVPFEGPSSSWHEGFVRYDFIMDAETHAITPYQSPPGENFGVKDPPERQRRCIVVVPKAAAPGNPWSWRGCYWDHQPQTEVELLRRGFHVAYISANAKLRPGPEWNAWYDFLTEKHGLARKPAFIGMSRGGEYAYTWSAAHPEKVSCIYADNPGANSDLLMRIGGLASNNVPILHICGSIDPLLGRYSTAFEEIYQQLGGRISVMIKDGAGHHPHSLHDPTPIADFISQSVKHFESPQPAYLAGRIAKTAFYSTRNIYREFPKEGTYITCRGPWFTGCYDRFAFELPNIETAITVIVPTSPAPGWPWVYQAEYARRDAAVDLELLARGFHIVTGPVPYNGDRPVSREWTRVYEHLVQHGFSPKPVMEGAGRAAAAIYAWALENPDKISCIYAENPVVLNASPRQSVDRLEVLAKAKVPLLHVCGGLDPALENETRTIEKAYRAFGGRMTVFVKENEGHYPLDPADPKPVADLIVQSVR